MVAITVILAAVIGTFVLDLGRNVQNTGPTASLGFDDAEADYDPGSATVQDLIVIEHQTGEPIEADSIRIVVRNVSENSIVTIWDRGPPAQDNATDRAFFELNGANMTAADQIQVGDTVTVRIEGGTVVGDGQDYTITVVSTETDNRIATGTVEVQ